MFDFESLTAREVALIETLSKQSISKIANEDSPKGNALAAMAMVAKRREGDNTFSFEKALDLPMSEINELLALNAEEDEDEGKAEASDASAPARKRNSSSSEA